MVTCVGPAFFERMTRAFEQLYLTRLEAHAAIAGPTPLPVS